MANLAFMWSLQPTRKSRAKSAMTLLVKTLKKRKT